MNNKLIPKFQDVEAVLSKEFPSGFDLVYEGVGGRMGNTAKKLLGKEGTLVSVGAVSTDYSGATKGDQGDNSTKSYLAGNIPCLFVSEET